MPDDSPSCIAKSRLPSRHLTVGRNARLTAPSSTRWADTAQINQPIIASCDT